MKTSIPSKRVDGCRDHKRRNYYVYMDTVYIKVSFYFMVVRKNKIQ